MNYDNTTLNNPDTAQRFTFLVFGQYTHGKLKGRTNRKSYVSMEVLGEDRYDLGHSGEVTHTPAFVDAIRRLKSMCAERDSKGRKINGDIAFQLVRRIPHIINEPKEQADAEAA